MLAVEIEENKQKVPKKQKSSLNWFAKQTNFFFSKCSFTGEGGRRALLDCKVARSNLRISPKNISRSQAQIETKTRRKNGPRSSAGVWVG